MKIMRGLATRAFAIHQDTLPLNVCLVVCIIVAGLPFFRKVCLGCEMQTPICQLALAFVLSACTWCTALHYRVNELGLQL